MSITVTFYTFPKKVNSTKLPTNSGTSFSCIVKEGCSIIEPVIELRMSSNPANWNYAYISNWNRYYHIKDWYTDHDAWIAHLQVDVLASFRAAIRSSSQYILRCSTDTDTRLIDHMYPMSTKVTFGKYDFPSRPLGNTLRYIIGITNAAGAHQVGGCTYYNLTYGELRSVIGLLLGSSSYLGDFSLDGLSDSLVKALVNPLQYIGSDTYILPYNIGGNTLDLLACGWWPVDPTYAYHVLDNNVLLNKHEIWRKEGVVIPAHPQTALGSFMNCSPYTRLTLYAGPFGHIELDPTVLSNCNRIDFVVNGDFKGNIELEIWGKQLENNALVPYLIDKRDANCAIPISLTQVNNDLTGLIGMSSSTINAGISAASGNPAGLCADIASGLDSAQDYFLPKAEGRAAVGSFDDILEDWVITAEFRNVADNAPNFFGKPLCKNEILSNLTGNPYVQCSGARIETEGTASENAQIISLLESGIYLE